VAAMAEVNVDRDSGDVKVKRLACVQDMGIVINPEGARQQMEGGLAMGLGYALREEIQFRGGAGSWITTSEPMPFPASRGFRK